MIMLKTTAVVLAMAALSGCGGGGTGMAGTICAQHFVDLANEWSNPHQSRDAEYRAAYATAKRFGITVLEVEEACAKANKGD